MRYLNWDVLLFPEESRVPLQEFRTTCHVTHASEPLHVHNSAGPAANPVAQRQLPIVTCFIPHLPRGSPFRISLHSWEEPEPSRGTRTLMSSDASVMFEVRVLLDGICVGGLLLDKDASWPQVIDTSTSKATYSLQAETGQRPDSYAGIADAKVEPEKGGDQECLRFPPFHQAMLTQNWWSAAEDVGRIKVLLSEGFASGQGPPLDFRRVKNVVCFSFQHAPLAILEEALIAWPNARMWYQQSAQQQFMPASPTKSGPIDLNPHAHSPRSRNTSRPNGDVAAAVVAPRLLSQMAMPPPTRRPTVTEPVWTSATIQDPFHEDYVHRGTMGSSTRFSSSDSSMPDYSYSITPRSGRQTSLHDVDQLQMEPTVGIRHASQFEEYLATYSPDRPTGTQAPPTTRVSSASNTPPADTSNASSLRAMSFHGQPRSVSITTGEAPLQSFRDMSDISMQSRFSAAHASDTEQNQTKPTGIPSGQVKGRKEGKSSETDLLAPVNSRKASAAAAGQRKKSTAQGSDENHTVSTDGKRKRSSVNSISNIVSEKQEDGTPSGRKASRMTEGSNTPEDVERRPLGSLENIQ